MINHIYNHSALANGFGIHTIRIPGAPKIFYGIQCASGLTREQPHERAHLHYLEHMFNYGSPRHGENDLIECFRKKVSSGNVNYVTSLNATLFFISALPAKADLFLERMGDVLTDPAFTSAHVEAERGPILQEYANTVDSESDQTYLAFMNLLYGNHALSRKAIGTKEQIEAVSYDSLRRIYQAHYTGPNMHLLAVGDVDHEQVVARSAPIFGRLPDRAVTSKPEPACFKGGTHVLAPRSADEATILLIAGFKAGGIREPLETQITEKVLTGIIGDALFTQLRNTKKIVYSARGSLEQNDRDGATCAQTVTNAANMDVVFDEMATTIAQTINTIGEEDLENRMCQLEEELAEKVADPRAVGEHALGDILHKGTVSPFQQHFDIAERLTPRDVQRAAARIVQNDPYLFIHGHVDRAPAAQDFAERVRSRVKPDVLALAG